MGAPEANDTVANFTASESRCAACSGSTSTELLLAASVTVGGAGSRNVRANVVAPGYVHSQLTDVLPEEATAAMLQNTPLGRLGDPEDVAGAVRFLCSDAAAYVTGVVLLVDGGLGM